MVILDFPETGNPPTTGILICAFQGFVVPVFRFRALLLAAPPLISPRNLPMKSQISPGRGGGCIEGAFLNFRPRKPIALLLIILRRSRCYARRFEWRLIPTTCGRFATRRELSEAAASACTRKRTASPHLPEPIPNRRSRHPRTYPRAKCFPRRYCENILASG